MFKNSSALYIRQYRTRRVFDTLVSIYEGTECRIVDGFIICGILKRCSITPTMLLIICNSTLACELGCAQAMVSSQVTLLLIKVSVKASSSHRCCSTYSSWKCCKWLWLSLTVIEAYYEEWCESENLKKDQW